MSEDTLINKEEWMYRVDMMLNIGDLAGLAFG